MAIMQGAFLHILGQFYRNIFFLIKVHIVCFNDNFLENLYQLILLDLWVLLFQHYSWTILDGRGLILLLVYLLPL